MMWDSLLKLRALPDDFKLYCGHEYTAANVKFALTVEPDNAALKARAEEVARLRAANKPTLPTLIGEEKKANVFLRADDPSVAVKLHMKGAGAAEVFGELRERKNKSDPDPDDEMTTAADIIARLELRPHPEGGHYRETFRDSRTDANGRARFDRDLFPAGARRAFALASHRCGRGLALLRRQRAHLADRQ